MIRIDALKSYLNLLPETRRLLKLAQNQGIDIIFDSNLKARGCLVRKTDRPRPFIDIKTGRTFRQTARTLIHELRHVEQAMILSGKLEAHAETADKNAAGPKLLPRLKSKILSTRFKEADAYAFSHVMERKLHRRRFNLDAQDIAAEAKTRDMQKLEELFVKKLSTLRYYDLRKIGEYQDNYADPGIDKTDYTLGQPAAKKIPGLRRILRAGTGRGAEVYLKGIEHKELIHMVLSPVDKDIRRTGRLVKMFEKAIENHDSPDKINDLRHKIQAAVVQMKRAS